MINIYSLSLIVPIKNLIIVTFDRYNYTIYLIRYKVSYYGGINHAIQNENTYDDQGQDGGFAESDCNV